MKTRSKFALVSCLFVCLLSLCSEAQGAKPYKYLSLKKSIVCGTKAVDLYSEEMVNLLLGTAAAESDFGTITFQVGGPALGVFQIEPATHRDLWTDYLAYRPKLRAKVQSTLWRHVPEKIQLAFNLSYQSAIAAIHYKRAMERLKYDKLPGKDDIWTQAWLYKKTFNTPLGKATTFRYYWKYREYVLENTSNSLWKSSPRLLQAMRGNRK